ncbi:MAG: hypothetical protein R3B93_11275 [Bacteroidia bacterium]
MTYHSSESQFYSNPVTKGVPNTVIFNYDVSKIRADSLPFSSHGTSGAELSLTPKITLTLPFIIIPDIFAKLLANDQIIREHDVYVESDGWMALLYNFPVPIYLPVQEEKGIMRVEKEKMEEFARNHPDALVELNYYLVQDLANYRAMIFIFRLVCAIPILFRKESAIKPGL